MVQAYGIGGVFNVLAAAVVGNGAPSANFRGELGQSYYDRLTSPPTEYVFNGQSWVSPTSTTLNFTTDSGVASVAANNINILGTGGITTSGSGDTVTVDGSGITVDLSSPPPIGDVAPNTIQATQLTTNGTGVVTLVSNGADDQAIVLTTSDPAGGMTINLGGNGLIVRSTFSLDMVAEGAGGISNTFSAVCSDTQAVSQVLAETEDGASGATAQLRAITPTRSYWAQLKGLTGEFEFFEDNGNPLNVRFTGIGDGVIYNSPTGTDVATNPVVVNGRTGAAVFTSVSIAAAADLTLTITNSAITASTTQVIYSMSGATTGSALSIKSVTNSAGSSAVVVTNGTGATTSTADITLTFIVINE